MPLTEPELKRLVHLLGMLGSSFDGEALNAARLAQRILTGRKLQWGDVLSAKPNGVKPSSGASAVQMTQAYQRGYDAGRRDAAKEAKEEAAQQSSQAEQPKWQKRRGPPPPFRPWADSASRILTFRSHRVSSWEHEFLESIQKRLYPPTEKQQAVLDGIMEKCGMQ